jgi:hypothetical protein
MRNILSVILLLSISVNTIAAMSTAEYFHQADKKQVLIGGGYVFQNTDSKTKGNSATETSKTSIEVEAEYGINDMFSAGIFLAQNYKNNNSGLSNYILFGKMRFDDFRFKFNLSISPDKTENDTFVTGGNFYELELGYEISKAMGLRLAITPEYDFEYKDDSTDYTQGMATVTSFYYELEHQFSMFGGEVAYLNYAAYEANGSTVGKDSNYLQLKLYANKDIMGFELIPTIAYANYLGDDSDKTQTQTEVEFKIRKRF